MDSRENMNIAMNDDELEKVAGGGVLGYGPDCVPCQQALFICSKENTLFSQNVPSYIRPEDYHAICPRCGARAFLA